MKIIKYSKCTRMKLERKVYVLSDYLSVLRVGLNLETRKYYQFKCVHKNFLKKIAVVRSCTKHV